MSKHNYKIKFFFNFRVFWTSDEQKSATINWNEILLTCIESSSFPFSYKATIWGFVMTTTICKWPLFWLAVPCATSFKKQHTLKNVQQRHSVELQCEWLGWAAVGWTGSHMHTFSQLGHHDHAAYYQYMGCMACFATYRSMIWVL